MRSSLWFTRLVIAMEFCFLLCEQTLAQTSSTQSIDQRVWSQSYWQKLAERGLVEVAPPVAYKAPAPTRTIAAMPGAPIDSPDVPVSPLTNITQSENSIFVHPNDLNTVLNSNNSTSWPVSSLFGSSGFISEDGGATWRGQPNGTGGTNSGDPATAIDRSGRFFVGYIAADGGQGVARSLDRGRTWTHVQAAVKRGASLLDKNHLWVDNSPTSPFVGNLYNAWTMFGGPNDAEIEITRSTDGGLNWSTPIVLSRNVNAGSHNQGVHIQTGPNGEVYVMWAIYDAFPADEAALGFALSRDGGATFEPARRILTNIRGIRSSGTNKDIRTAAFPVMAADLSNSPRRGTLYAVWTNHGVPGSNLGNDVDGYLIKSTDHGATWSSPTRINQDAPNLGKQHFFHWIACDAANGNLSVIYYDDRNVSSVNSETFVSNSTDGGANWIDFRVSDVAFRPAPIPGLATGYFGDYLGITALGGKIYPAWTDNRDGRAMTYVSPFILEQDSIPPAPITDLSAGAPASNGIILQWTARGDDADSGRASSYDIRYALAPIDSLTFATATRAPNRLVPQLPGTVETFEVTGLNFNTTYFFAVKILDEQGNGSPISNSPSATTLGEPRIVITPLSLAETLLTGAQSVQTLTLRNIGEGTLDFSMRATSSSNWLTVAPDSGRAATESPFVVQVHFDASGLDGAGYDGEIFITSNDPTNATLRVPVRLQVLGAPDINFSASFLDFDSVFVNDTLKLKLEVSNLGTDTLTVNLAASAPFAASLNAFTLAPRASEMVEVAFLPLTLGTFADSLIFTSNDPDEARVAIALRGESLPPPEIALTPSRLDENLIIGQTRQQPLTISNTGQSALNFELAFENVQVRLSGLRPDRTRENATATEVFNAETRAALRQELSQLARAATTGLEFPAKMADDSEGLAPALLAKFRAQVQPYAQLVERVKRTGDMPSLAVAGFNSASLLSVLLSLSNSVSDYAYTDVGDNFTLATLNSFDGVLVDERDFRLSLVEAEALRDYAASGKPVFIGMDDFDNLTADVQAVIYPLLGVSAAFDRDFVFGAFNPAHPIAQNLTSMELFNSTDNDYFTLAGADWLFADPANNYFGVAHQSSSRTVLFGESLFAIVLNNPDNLLLLSNAIDWIAAGATGWVTLNKTTGRIAPGATDTITVTFSAVGLRGGDYTADLVVASNDPDEKRTIVPVHLVIANAPDIAVASDTLDFGEVFIGVQDSLFATVTNAGTLNLLITSAVVAPEVFTVSPPFAGIDPGAKENFKVSFMPSATGDFVGTLTLTNNDPDENPTRLTLLGKGVMPPVIAVAPDSFAFALNTGDSTSATLMISNHGGSDLNFTLRDVENNGSGAGGPFLFWSQEYQAGPDTIFRANLDGTSIRPIYIADLQAGYGSIAHHPGEGRIYSAEFSEGRIFSVKVDGSDPRILVSGLRTLFDIVLDLNAGHMYWAENGAGVIKRANLDGSGVIIVVQSFAPGATGSAPVSKQLLKNSSTTASVLSSPWALDLDLRNGKIYWSELGTRRIARSNLDGTGVETVNASVGTPIALKLDLSAGKIYFVDNNNGNIMRMNLDGTGQEIVLQTFSTSIGDFKLELSAQKFYWTNYGTDQITRANFDGGNVTPIVTRFANSADGPFAFGLAGGNNWLFETPAQGTLAAGASLPVTLEVKSKGLLGGNYRATIFLNSNDPLTPERQVPVTLQVTGVPVVAAAPDTIAFGQVFIGFAQHAALTITNSGTADLRISNVQVHPPVFTIGDATDFALPPGATKTLTLFFKPEAAQSYSGALTFDTNTMNNPTVSVVLLGEGVLAPVIAARPDSLCDSLKINTSSFKTLTLNNNGGTELVWSASIDFSSASTVLRQSPRLDSQPILEPEKSLATPPKLARENIFTFPLAGAQGLAVRQPDEAYALDPKLDSVRVKMNRNFAQVNRAIPNRHDFSDGETGSSISDGGEDMYDGGNILSTNFGSPVFYSNNVIVSNRLFGTNGRYFTRKYPGLFLLAADLDNVNDFILDGNLGADGAGNADGAILETTLFGVTYHGFVKRVFNAGDPSVNHLILLAQNPATTHEFSTDTNSDFQAVRNLHATTRLYYLLYAGASGGYIDNAATLNIMNAFLGALELLPVWLTLAPASGVIPANAAQEVQARFDATGLAVGNYRARIALASNDPNTPRLQVPACLQVRASDVLLALADSTFGVPRDTVNVPVSVEFSIPRTLQALQAAIKLSNAQLAFLSYTPGPIVSRGLRVHAPSADSVSITFAGDGGQYLNQSGVLATLHFRIAESATPGQVTALRFLHLSAMDSAGAAPTLASHEGLFFARKAPEVSGNVKYARLSGGNSAQPVAELAVVLSRNGAAVQEQTTNNSGNYTLPGILPRTNYRVELRRDSGGLGTAITPMDALLAYNGYLGNLTLTGAQNLAADVDADLNITAGDALAIFNRFLGVTKQYPVADWRTFPASYAIDGNPTAWKTAPTGIAYPVINADQLNQDYMAVARGDVDLNWKSGANAAALITATQSDAPAANAVVFKLAEARLVPGTDKILVPIQLNGVALDRGLYAFGGELQYASTQFQITAVHWGAIVPQQDFRASYALAQAARGLEAGAAENETPRTGRLRFGGFATLHGAIRQNGVLLEIEARLLGNAQAGAKLLLRLHETSAALGASSLALQAGASFEAARASVEQSDGVVLAAPATFALHSNYPNPFNPTTELRYQLPEPATVSLTIYNALGQKVRALVHSEKQTGGYYRHTWDGKNEAGEMASAGVYFYHLEAQSANVRFQRTNKMLMLK